VSGTGAVMTDASMNLPPHVCGCVDDDHVVDDVDEERVKEHVDNNPMYARTLMARQTRRSRPVR